MISVVIPAWNAAATIERALDSVFKQTHADFEVLVVDDGSTDSTAEIVQFHAHRDPRVRLITIDHAGPGAARNAGIAAATGEWIVFLDADDEYTPRAFEKVLNRVTDENVGLVIFSIHVERSYIYSWPGQFVRLKNEYFEGDGERATGLVGAYFDRKRLLIYSQSNKFYRKSTLDAHGIRFPEGNHFGEDRLFNFAYLRVAGSVITMRDKFLIYNQGRPGTMTARATSNETATLLMLAEAKLDLFRDYGYSEEDLEEFKRHNAKEFLPEVNRALIFSARQAGFWATRKAVRNLVKAPLDRRYFLAEAATSRRIRALQRVLGTRSTTLVTALIYAMRTRENRHILRRRASEIDTKSELECLHLTNARAKEVRKYYLLADYEYFLDVVNPESSRQLLRDKGVLLNRLHQANPDYIGRDWLDLRTATFEDFLILTKNNRRVVAKLYDGSWSSGTSIIDTDSIAFDAATWYDKLVAEKQYIVEGYIDQHPDIARFYGQAVASLRVHTLNLGGNVELVLRPMIKFGSAGHVTSNRQQVEAFVDLDAGTIITDGILEAAYKGSKNTVHTTHPNSGTAFKFAPYPYAAETKELVTAAAALMPELRFIGWDVAMTPTGPVLLEGNAASLIIYSWQFMSRRFFGVQGMRRDFEKMLAKCDRFERKELLRRTRFGQLNTKGYAWQPPS